MLTSRSGLIMCFNVAQKALFSRICKKFDLLQANFNKLGPIITSYARLRHIGCIQYRCCFAQPKFHKEIGARARIVWHCAINFAFCDTLRSFCVEANYFYTLSGLTTHFYPLRSILTAVKVRIDHEQRILVHSR